MKEAKATFCFCGCGARVVHPRLVVTNTNGWELSDELAEWAKLQIFSARAGLDLAGGDLADNIASGQSLWLSLREAMHSGERADRDDEKTAVVWRKHAKKARRKLGKQFRRDGLPDPFGLPDLAPQELSAWVTEAREPAWTADLDASAAADDDSAVEGTVAAYDHVDHDSDDGDLDYTGALAPSVMLEHLNDYTAEVPGPDREAVILVYLRESFGDTFETMSDSTKDLVFNIGWAGYCTRSIAIAEVPEAVEEAAMVRSLLEWNTENSDSEEPMFVSAVSAAGHAAGLGDQPLDDLALRAAWITVPGATTPSGEGVDDAVLPLEQLSFVGAVAAIEAFSDDEQQLARDEGVTDSMAKSAWLYGYFLRVQEQYSPQPDLWTGASEWIYGTSTETE